MWHPPMAVPNPVPIATPKCIICARFRPIVMRQLDTWSAALILYATVRDGTHKMEKARELFKQSQTFCCGQHLIYWHHHVVKYLKEMIDLPFLNPKFAVALRDVRIIFNARFPLRDEFSMVQSPSVEKAILEFVPQFKDAIKSFVMEFVKNYKLLEPAEPPTGLLKFAPLQPYLAWAPEPPPPPVPKTAEEPVRRRPRKRSVTFKIVAQPSPTQDPTTPNTPEEPAVVHPIVQEAQLTLKIEDVEAHNSQRLNSTQKVIQWLTKTGPELEQSVVVYENQENRPIASGRECENGRIAKEKGAGHILSEAHQKDRKEGKDAPKASGAQDPIAGKLQALSAPNAPSAPDELEEARRILERIQSFQLLQEPPNETSSSPPTKKMRVWPMKVSENRENK